MNPNFPRAYFWLAAALEQLNWLDEAKSTVQAGLALVPTYTVRWFRDHASNDHPTFLAQRERIVEGMRKAGLPEG
jgi:hypothetical protein